MIRCLGPGWRLRWGFWPVLYYPTPAKCFRACSEVTDARARCWKNGRMTAESLARVMEEFLGGSHNAVVVEDGARIFDLNESKYSISGEYNKCLLHLWSSERNVVRRILDCEVRNGNLRLMVQKLGQSRPSKLEICKGHDHRTPTARRAARATYQVHLRRAIERHFPDFTLTKLSNAMDLERSFGPI